MVSEVLDGIPFFAALPTPIAGPLGIGPDVKTIIPHAAKGAWANVLTAACRGHAPQGNIPPDQV